MDTDVIIVGAGPTGLSLACQLIRYSIDFVLVEKSQGVTPFSKALGVHARTLEIYEQLGLAQEAVAQGTIAGKVRLLEGGHVRGELDLSNLGHGMSAYPYLLVLEQNKNEKLLYGYLQSHGKDVLWQTELESFSQSGGGVTAHLRDAGGATQIIEARYLVGCDGPRSTVRHALGLSFAGSTFERLFYVADVQMDWPFSHDALHVCLVPNSVVASFPMPGQSRYRIVGAFPEGVDKEEGDIVFDEIEERVKEEVEVPLDISHVNWFSVYKVHTRHAERFSKGRCFLAGDAAHIHTPAGGQGMNTGIQDAYNLAWKLAFVLKGNASERILDSYNQERLENAKRLLGTTDRMFTITAGSDWLLGFLRTTIFPPLAGYIVSSDVVKKRFFPLISQIGIRYDASALSNHEGDEGFAMKAGDRLPYFLVEGRSLYDKLHAPRFHLLTFSDGTSDHQDIRKEVEAAFSRVLDYQVVPLYPPVAELFGAAADRSFHVLVRPDNYIGMISQDTSLREVRAYLSEVIGHESTGPLPQVSL